MHEGPTLRAEDQVSHYKIVGPLGAGGMGEVYLAKDQNLDRSVALKILPPSLIRNEDRVRRFVLEAKSASSLNHPNIVTIFDIGQEDVKSADGSSSTRVHFISMELVNGDTLTAKIHQEKTELRTLLGWLAQAAEGIAKAHAAGIVHRDLKPGNIMISQDGFAKVLDFGLAKLTEKRDSAPDVTNAPTLTEGTVIGAVMGTVGYMSPEQVAGKPVDARADIFAFGCILYEAATRQQPFIAETSVEIMNKILNERPVAIEDVNPKVPAELRRVIRRCLAKSPDQRFQSMKDVAIELREIVDEYDALSASASSGSGASVAGVLPAQARRKLPLIQVAGAGALVLAVAAFLVVRGSHHTGPTGPTAQVRINAQTNRGDVIECAISGDGRYLAYIPSQGGIAGVHVRQVATGSDVEVVPAMNAQIFGLTFSPDGNYLYFLGPKQDNPRYRALYQVPSLGGRPVEKTFDVDTRVSFAPDGKQFCFMRGLPQSAADNLIVSDLESAKERIVASILHSDVPQGWTGPAWSPDGKTILLGEQHFAPRVLSLLKRYPVSGGTPTVLAKLRNYIIDNFAWVPDGKALAVTGTDLNRGFNNQVSLVSNSGDIRPITNDVSEYTGVSVSAGEEAIAVKRRTQLGNFWVADISGGPPTQLTHMTNPENTLSAIGVGDSATLVFMAAEGGGIPIYAVPVSGGEPHRLTDPGLICYGLAGYQGGALFGQLDANGDGHIWSMRLDGTGKRQATSGRGENPLDASADGRYFTYQDEAGVLNCKSLAGEPPIQFHAPGSDKPARIGGRFSPDGKWMYFNSDATVNGLQRVVTHIVPAGGGTEAVTDTLPPGALKGFWGADIHEGIYQTTADPANLYQRTVGRADLRLLTAFKEGRIEQCDFASDRRHFAVTRTVGTVGNVWVCDADGSHPLQVTRFTDGQVFQLHWMPDNRRIAVLAGPRSGDAVLIKSFR